MSQYSPSEVRSAMDAGEMKPPVGVQSVPSLSGSKPLITIGVMLAGLMAFLDISIVNVALTDIRANFGTPLDQIGWISTSYMMANVVIIPLTGFLQRRFGFRRYFVGSVLLFVSASILCAMAWNLPSLVLFRILQGCGGGAIIPTANAILLSRYPNEQQGLANGLFGLGAVTGPLLGPTLGGYLINVSNWHWIFLINVPIGVTSAILVWRFLEQPGFSPSRQPMERVSLALLVCGLGSLQYVLEEGHRNDWLESSTVVLGTIVAVASLVTFAVRQLEISNPIVDLRIFANRNYSAATLINFLLGIALFSGTYLSSLFSGAVMRYDALTIGMVTLGPGLMQFFLMPVIGQSASRFDKRLLLAIGAALMCTSLWMTAHLNASVSFDQIVRPSYFRFLSTGFLFIPLALTALSDLTPDARGNAAGLFNLTRELGGSCGTAILSTMLDTRTRLHAARLGEHLTSIDPSTQWQLAGMRAIAGFRSPDADGAAYYLLNMKVSHVSLAWAFQDCFFALMLAFMLCFPLLLLLRFPTDSALTSQQVHLSE